MNVCRHDWAEFLAKLDRITVAQERSAAALEAMATTMNDDATLQEFITDMRNKTAALGGVIPKT